MCLSVMSDFNVWSYFAKVGVQVRVASDPFFEEGNRLCKVDEPIQLTVEDVEEFLHIDYNEFPCQIPGCPARFNQVYESEVHYNAVHKHNCSVCKKSLPSYHLLELHIQENHDSFFSILSEKKPSFQCFLPTCSCKFWSVEERRDHAISTHNFPPDFRFDQGKRKPRKKSSKENNCHSSASATPSTTLSVDGRKGRGLEGMETDHSNNTNTMTEAVEARPASRVAGAHGNRRERRQAARTQATNRHDPHSQPPVVRNGGGEETAMEMEQEVVVLRRSHGPKRPMSLARLGERRSVCIDASPSTPSSPSPLCSPTSSHNTSLTSTTSLIKKSFHATSPDISQDDSCSMGATDTTTPSVSSPRNRLPIATFRNGGGGGVSPVARSDRTSLRTEIGSPISYIASVNKKSLGAVSPVFSPRKSKIPVRSNSLRTPKTFSFGAGVPKAFQRPKSKNWYQSSQSIDAVAMDLQQSSNTTDMSALGRTLPSC